MYQLWEWQILEVEEKRTKIFCRTIISAKEFITLLFPNTLAFCLLFLTDMKQCGAGAVLWHTAVASMLRLCASSSSSSQNNLHSSGGPIYSPLWLNWMQNNKTHKSVEKQGRQSHPLISFVDLLSPVLFIKPQDHNHLLITIAVSLSFPSVCCLLISE